MTDNQLRAIIRDAVARHLAGTGQTAVPPSPGSPDVLGSRRPVFGEPQPPASPDPGGLAGPGSSATLASLHNAVSIASAPGGIAVAAAPGSIVHLHVSHATFSLPSALDGSFDGPCRTEPHANCTSCGFCQSLGY